MLRFSHCSNSFISSQITEIWYAFLNAVEHKRWLNINDYKVAIQIFSFSSNGTHKAWDLEGCYCLIGNGRLVPLSCHILLRQLDLAIEGTWTLT